MCCGWVCGEGLGSVGGKGKGRGVVGGGQWLVVGGQ